MILGGAAKTRGPVRRLLSEFGCNRGVGHAQSVVWCIYCDESHTSTGESLALFLSVTVLHVFCGMVHLFRRASGRWGFGWLSGGTRLIF